MAKLLKGQILGLDAKQIDLTEAPAMEGQAHAGRLNVADSFSVHDAVDPSGNDALTKKCTAQNLVDFLEANINALSSNTTISGQLTANNAAALLVGPDDGTGTVQSGGAQSLVLRTGTADRGSILIRDGANDNLDLLPTGTGVVKLPAGYEGRLGLDGDSVVTQKMLESKVFGLRWMKPVRFATSAALPGAAVPVSSSSGNTLDGGSDDTALGSIDGRNPQVGDRIAVKDQPGVKGYLEFTIDAVPGNDTNIILRMNAQSGALGSSGANPGDIFWKIEFENRASNEGSWTTTANGTAVGTPFVIKVKRADADGSNVVSVSDIANSIRSVFGGGFTEGKIESSVVGARVRLDQVQPMTHVYNIGVQSDGAGCIDDDPDIAASDGKSSYNGIFKIDRLGGDGQPNDGKWRLLKEDDWKDVNRYASAAFLCKEGTVNADQMFTQINDHMSDAEKSHVDFQQISGLAQIDASNGLDKSGSTLGINSKKRYAKGAVDAGNSGTHLGKNNVLRLSSILTDADAITDNGHFAYNDNILFLNGNANELFNGLKNMTGQGNFSGTNEYQFVNNGNNVDLYIHLTAAGTPNTVKELYAGGDIAVHMSVVKGDGS